jgi:uracil-DNA glycosylase
MCIVKHEINKNISIMVHKSWQDFFSKYKSDLENIFEYINKFDKTLIYPSEDKIFRVFEMDVNDIRIVLLGQDPYHNKGQANGLSFSVEKGIKIPPSLQNIYKELKYEFPDRNYTFEHGDLSEWFVREKIFLLNASLTVMDSKPSCFMKQWRIFTDNVIKFIDNNNSKCIFLLLGNFAKSKMKYLRDDTYIKRVVYATHPSPLSAYNGFFGSMVFNNVEKILGEEINWNIE